MVSARAAGVEVGRLEHRADPQRRPVDPRVGLLEDERPPARSVPQAEQHPQGRRLAGAVRAKEAGDRPRLERERQVVDSDELAESLRQRITENNLRHGFTPIAGTGIRHSQRTGDVSTSTRRRRVHRPAVCRPSDAPRRRPAPAPGRARRPAEPGRPRGPASSAAPSSSRMMFAPCASAAALYMAIGLGTPWRPKPQSEESTSFRRDQVERLRMRPQRLGRSTCSSRWLTKPTAIFLGSCL